MYLFCTAHVHIRKDARDRREAQKDVGTQKSLEDNADNVRVSIDDGEYEQEQEGKAGEHEEVDADGEDRVRNEYGDDATENEEKIKVMSTAQDEYDEGNRAGTGNGEHEDNESSEEMQQQQRPTVDMQDNANADANAGLDMHENEDDAAEEDDQDQSVSLEEIELTQIQAQKCKQLKQLMVEKLLADGIERTVSVLETFKYIPEYEPSRVIVPGDPLRYYCWS